MQGGIEWIYGNDAGAIDGVAPAGNTSGVTAVVTNGTLTLAGGANITLSQAAGNAITIIGGAGGGGGTGVAISAGTQSVSTGTVVFSNSNGISFGLSGSSRITASHNGLTTQSGQAFSADGGSSTFETLVFRNANGLSFSNSGGSVQASYTVPTQTVQPGIQSVSAGTTRITTGEVVFSNANGISFGANGQTLTASYTVPTQSTQPALQSLSAGTTRVTTGEVVFSNSNGISFGVNGQTVTASYTVPSQSVQPGIQSISAGTTRITTGQAIFADGNGISFGANGQTVTASYTVPTVTNSSWTVSDAATSLTVARLAFTNVNGLTLSLSTTTGGSATVVGSYTVPAVPAQFSGGLSNLGNTAGDTGVVTGRLVLVGSNGVSLSGATNGGSQTISILPPVQTNQTVGLYASSNTTGQSSSSTADARSLTFRGAGVASVGLSAGEVVISVPAGGGAGDGGNVLAAGTQTATSLGTVLFADSNGITFGMSGSTRITASHNGLTTALEAGISSDGFTAGNSGVVTGQLVLYPAGNMYMNQATAAGGSASLTIAGIPVVVSQNGNTAGATGVWFGQAFLSGGSNLTVSVDTFSQAYGAITNTHQIIGLHAANQSAQTVGLYGSSQTTGSASSGTLDARSLSIIGAGIVSVGMHSTSVGGTTTGLIVSATQSNQALSGSNGSFAFQTATFGNLNGLSFYTSNGSMVGSYTVPTVPAQMSAGLSTGGNTSGDTGVVTGRLVLAGGNNITLSGSTNGGSMTVTVSAGAGGGGAALSAGTQSVNTGTVLFADSNGISFGMSGSSRITASYTVPTQSAQTLGVYHVGNTTGQSSSSTVDARSVSIDGAGIVSAGWSNGTIRISATQSAQTLGLYHVGNTTGQSSSSTVDARSVSFDGAGIVSVGMSAGSVRISATQSNQAASASNGSFTFQTLNFSNANNVTFGTSAGGIVTASVAAPGAAAEQNALNLLGANTAGNTTATGSTIGLSGLNLTLSGTNASQVVISAPATSSLSATGIVSLSTNGSTISIGAAQTTLSGTHPYLNAMYALAAQSNASLLLAPIVVEVPFQYDRFVMPLHYSQATNSTLTVTNSIWWGFFSRTGSTLSLYKSGSGTFSINGSGTASSSANSGIRIVSMASTDTITQGNYILGYVWRSTTSSNNASLSNLVASQIQSSVSGYLGVGSVTNQASIPGMGVWTSTTAGMPNSVALSDIRANSSAYQRPPICYFTSGALL